MGTWCLNMASFLDQVEQEIDTLIEYDTYQEISDYLRLMFPDQNRLSPRSIRRFCAERGMGRHRNSISNDNLDGIIRSQVLSPWAIRTEEGVCMVCYRLWALWRARTEWASHFAERFLSTMIFGD